jgi:hypothetical protein
LACKLPGDCEGPFLELEAEAAEADATEAETDEAAARDDAAAREDVTESATVV